MIINLVKYLKLKHRTEVNNRITNWVESCLESETISFKGKLELLDGYYGRLESKKGQL